MYMIYRNLFALNVILGSFGALLSKWYVTRVDVELNELNLRPSELLVLQVISDHPYSSFVLKGMAVG